MKYQIKKIESSEVIYEANCASLKKCVELCLAAKKSLARANLSGADLSGADLSGANLARANLARANLARANLSDTNLARANLAGADLAGADLSRASLSRANLAGADLSDTNLARANLAGADLASADLSRTKGIIPARTTPLLMLLDQPGKIRAYKLVNELGQGPTYGGLVFAVGKSLSVQNANTDSSVQCGAGINVATLDWCLREWVPESKIMTVEFEAVDIAAIPTASDGKFRLHRCKVVGEKNVSHIVESA